ncbi:hypothetical protein CMO88_01015 [Candidatus Woesearchaeota archaeon]|nr:hypothetical protein [Candidatus Woesearchaeota archaeon]
MKTTMIQVKKDTAVKLKELKDYNRQSYDDIIRKLIQTNDTDVLTKEDINDIRQGLEDIRAGRTVSLEKAAKELGVKLKG